MLAEDSASQVVKEKISSALDTMRQINALQEEITIHLAHEERKEQWHNRCKGVQSMVHPISPELIMAVADSLTFLLDAAAFSRGP